MTKLQHQELAEELYERTIDFINNETIEMLYDLNMVEESSDDAIHTASKVIYHFLNKQLTKHW